MWGPYIQTCIDLFGAHRAMFESNFPVDKMGVGYAALWNAFKRIAAGASRRERALFHDNARRVSRLGAAKEFRHSPGSKRSMRCPIAAHGPSMVRPAALYSNALSLAKAVSIELKPGG